MVIEYLYTLEVPDIHTMEQAKCAFTLGDKYSLPKLRGAGTVRLIFFHRLFWDSWVHLNDELRIRRLEHLEEVWEWPYPETEEFKNAILDSFCRSANATIEYTKVQHLLSRNTDFAIDLIKVLAKNQKNTPSTAWDSPSTTRGSKKVSPKEVRSVWSGF